MKELRGFIKKWRMCNQYFERMLIKVATLTCIALILGISTSVGIGGATLINILLIIGFDYSVKEAIVITYIFLMGGGLAASVVGAKKLTPKGKRLIDYDLVLITLPMMMSGSIFGTIVNHFASDAAITIIFAILMLYMLRSSLSQIRQARLSEGVQLQTSSLKQELLEIKSDINSKNRLEELLEQEKNLIPWGKLKIVMHIYVYTILEVLFRGGTEFTSIIGLQSCNVGSWICVLLHFILSYLYCKSIAIKKFQNDAEKQSLGFVFEDLREKMNYEKMREAMFNGFLAGTIGGCLAVSGGLVLIPLWLKTGIDRNIVTNSTAPLIFFGASISFFISLLLGLYDSFALVLLFFLISFIGSYFIKNFVHSLQKRHNLKTIQCWILMFIMSVSLLTFLPVQYEKYRTNTEAFMAFKTLC